MFEHSTTNECNSPVIFYTTQTCANYWNYYDIDQRCFSMRCYPCCLLLGGLIVAKYETKVQLDESNNNKLLCFQCSCVVRKPLVYYFRLRLKQPLNVTFLQSNIKNYLQYLIQTNKYLSLSPSIYIYMNCLYSLLNLQHHLLTILESNRIRLAFKLLLN